MTKSTPIKNWEKLQDEEILGIRVRDLGLKIQNSPLEPLVNKLYEELDAKNICFHPPCYLADEWLCPDRVPIIGIPFYLAHHRLAHIERRMMFEVEGGTEQSCIRLLRHECGHAVNYAYRLYTKTRWRELFGPFSTTYSDSYHFQPYSRRYVIHLQDNYAQSHPDEDFAETFAVWLTPKNNWQEKYVGWPVIKKLQYVDKLMKKIEQQPSLATACEHPPWSAARMTSTLAAYYERKRRELGPAFQGYYDDSLKRLFAPDHSDASNSKASTLLRRHRRVLIDYVSLLTGHRKFDMHQLVKRLIARCDALDLYPKTNEAQSLIGLTALLTAIASNTLRVKRRHRHR